MLEELVEELNVYYDGGSGSPKQWDVKIDALPEYIPIVEVESSVKNFLKITGLSYQQYAGLVGVSKRTVVEWFNNPDYKRMTRDALRPLNNVFKHQDKKSRSQKYMDNQKVNPYFQAYKILSGKKNREIISELALEERFRKSTTKNFLKKSYPKVPEEVFEFFKQRLERFGVESKEEVEEVLKKYEPVKTAEIQPAFKTYSFYTGIPQTELSKELVEKHNLKIKPESLFEYLNYFTDKNEKELTLPKILKQDLESRLIKEFNIEVDEVPVLHEKITSTGFQRRARLPYASVLYLYEANQEVLKEALVKHSEVNPAIVEKGLKELNQKNTFQLDREFVNALESLYTKENSNYSNKQRLEILNESTDLLRQPDFENIKAYLKTYVLLQEEKELETIKELAGQENITSIDLYISYLKLQKKEKANSEFKKIKSSVEDKILNKKSYLYYAKRYDYEKTVVSKQEFQSSVEAAKELTSMNEKILMYNLSRYLNTEIEDIAIYFNGATIIPKKLKDTVEGMIAKKINQDASPTMNQELIQKVFKKKNWQTGDYILNPNQKTISQVHKNIVNLKIEYSPSEI